MANRAIPSGVKAQAPGLRAEGMSIRQVALRLGLSRQTVRRVLAAAALLVAPGDGVLLSTTEAGMTGLVSGWLAAHHAPALVADDYQLVASPDHVLVVPVRAGYVCPGQAMVSLPSEVAVGLFDAMLARARERA